MWNKSNGQKYKYLSSLPDLHSFVYCKYIYSKEKKAFFPEMLSQKNRHSRLKTNPLVFFLQEDGAEIKRQVCQSCITQALVDVYIANMISRDNHWQRLQFHQAHDLCCKCSNRGKKGGCRPILSRSRDSLEGFVPRWKKLIAFQLERS